jgi:ABC-type lipoprotein release transport system permease subunit
LTPPVKFAKYPLFVEQLEQTGVVDAATAVVSAQGLLHLGKGNVRAVRIWGIEPGKRAKVTGFKQSLRKQSQLPDDPSFEVSGLPERVGGFLGIGVVAEPDEATDEYAFDEIEEEMIGRNVVIVTGTQVDSTGEGTTEVSPSNEAGSDGRRFRRKNIPFTVTDIVFTGVYYLDKNFVYLPIEELQKRLYPNEASPIADQIQIKLASDVETDAALAVIRGVWQDFASRQLGWGPYLIRGTDIQTAKQMQSQYVVELMKQLGVLLLIFGVVSFGVVLLVFCIFYMIVRLKQKDIAILKSCGATSTSVAVIFVGYGACVGIIGSGVGTILGAVITRNINAIEEWIRIIFRLKLWKSSVYIFSRIPNQINWDWALLIVLSAVVAVAVGALIPAVIGARTKPVDILRYE